ncbi:hypothetical protein SGRIM128S_08888 [Streptomyces griseomycini]
MTAFNDDAVTGDALRRTLGVSRRRFLSTCTAAATAAIAAPVFGAAPALAQDGAEAARRGPRPFRSGPAAQARHHPLHRP